MIVLTYHFPPGQAAGALRWQKLTGYAAARGWGLDVITLDPASLLAPDRGRLAELPEGIRVFGVPDRPLFVERLERLAHSARRKLRTSRAVRARVSVARQEMVVRPLSVRFWIRAYDGWLEDTRELDWSLRAAQLGRALFRPGVHRAVVSCGPPQLVHEGARRLAEKTGLPLVIDLRDPWSLVERVPEVHASPLRIRRAARLEARVVARADLVAMNTERASRAMRELYPARANQIITVMNGVDEDEPLPCARADARFLIAYAGSIYLDRNPHNFFRAAARVVRESALSPDDLGIEFMGPTEPGMELLAMAADEGLERFVRMHPPGTRREAGEFLARAALLLNLAQDSQLAIPSKIFEYMRYAAWILALEPKESATELLLRDTEADVVAPDDVEGIADVLRRRYRAFAAGERAKPIARDPRLGRAAQADRLFSEIERIAGPPSGAARAMV